MLLSVSTFIALLAFWLLLSGQFTPFLIAAGVGSAAAVVLFARRMEVVDREGHPITLWRVVVFYWPWLMKEIVKSAWVVSRVILHPKLPISPELVRFRPTQRSAAGLVTHANSITLTRSGAEGDVDSEMDRRITKLEKAR
jgi:multicomponent Na+:H+ antiporter subunit E